MQQYHSNGKLLLSAEYLILDGAVGLALPTTFGQHMEVFENSKNFLTWESLDNTGKTWFKADFDLPDLQIRQWEGDKNVAFTLKNILFTAKSMNPDFLEHNKGFKVTTQLDFPRNWGLGSSSTLINNIAQWSATDAFRLLFESFGGSGYDIACAQNDTAILYSLKNGLPLTEPVLFDPPFSDQLYFVHLNKKQVSSDSIADYRTKNVEAGLIESISEISKLLLTCKHINNFNELLKLHESIIAGILETNPVQSKLFPDFFGQIKSLGAWGGDFVLATGDESTPSYFTDKGFETVIRYNSMIKKI
jgi:mevalonate kinase